MRTGRPTVAPVDRFWQYAVPEPNSGCWLWVGCSSKKGYGRFWSGGRHGPQVFAHRWAWQHFVGSIPAGLEIDHKCKTTVCVNPEHLQVVTHHFNAGQARRDAVHCPQGHLLDGVKRRKNSTMRYCKTCAVMYSRRYRKALEGVSFLRPNE